MGVRGRLLGDVDSKKGLQKNNQGGRLVGKMLLQGRSREACGHHLIINLVEDWVSYGGCTFPWDVIKTRVN